MAHYAYLDENNIVTQVIVGKDETEDGTDWEEYYGAKRCSYNTHGGVHALGKEPFRMNYPGEGWFFDPAWEPDGAFIPPKIFPSWVLNEETALWNAPIPRPSEGAWEWDEQNMTWIELLVPNPPLV